MPTSARRAPGPVGTFDLVIVRENTEGFYPDRNMYAGSGEFMPDPDTALSVRKISAAACRRIARRSFALARRRRRKVTAIHKANNFILSDGLFLREVRAAATDFPDVALDEVLLNAAAALKKLTPENSDQQVGIGIVRKALEAPLRQIAENAGVDGSVVASKIRESKDLRYGFDAQREAYCDMVTSGIIDPALVVRAALQDAASVAGLLITTEAMVAERPEPKDGGGGMPPGGDMGGMGGMGGMGF